MRSSPLHMHAASCFGLIILSTVTYWCMTAEYRGCVCKCMYVSAANRLYVHCESPKRVTSCSTLSLSQSRLDDRIINQKIVWLSFFVLSPSLLPRSKWFMQSGSCQTGGVKREFTTRFTERERNEERRRPKVCGHTSPHLLHKISTCVVTWITFDSPRFKTFDPKWRHGMNAQMW